jgi:hypothetical protein
MVPAFVCAPATAPPGTTAHKQIAKMKLVTLTMKPREIRLRQMRFSSMAASQAPRYPYLGDRIGDVGDVEEIQFPFVISPHRSPM